MPARANACSVPSKDAETLIVHTSVRAHVGAAATSYVLSGVSPTHLSLHADCFASLTKTLYRQQT